MPTHTISLTSQVGGHAGIQTTEDGSLIIKPAFPLEHAFYSALNSTSDPKLGNLRPWVPKFYGTLKLHASEQDAEKAIKDIASAPGQALVAAATASSSKQSTEDSKESLVLDNLSYGFIKPNIIDIKLGTILYTEDAGKEKKERMQKVARDTTSFETGVRLTGFQVHDNNTGQAVNTPKSYGKSITKDQLGEGIAKFFPIASPTPSNSLGLPAPFLLPILTHILHDVKQIKNVLSELEIRLIGGSLFIVYEGDLDRVKSGVQTYSTKRQTKPEEEMAKEEDEEGEEEEEEDSDEEVVQKAMSDETSSSSEDESSDVDSDDLELLNKKPATNKPKSSRTPFYRVRLIDFAHTRFDKGPDTGVIKGLETTIRLLEDRIREVREIIANSEGI